MNQIEYLHDSRPTESDLDVAWKTIPNVDHFRETVELNSGSPTFLNIIKCNTMTPDEVYTYIVYTLGTLVNVVSFDINKTKAKIYIFGADPCGGGYVSCRMKLMNNKTVEFRRSRGERVFALSLFSYFTEMMKYLANPIALCCPDIPSFTFGGPLKDRLPITEISESTRDDISTCVDYFVESMTSKYGDIVYSGCNLCNIITIKQDETKEHFAKNHTIINALLSVLTSDAFSANVFTIGIIALNTIATASSFPATYKKMQEESKDSWDKLFSRKSFGDTYEFVLYHHHIDKLQKLIDSF
jgi:hypothetical protein